MPHPVLVFGIQLMLIPQPVRDIQLMLKPHPTGRVPPYKDSVAGSLRVECTMTFAVLLRVELLAEYMGAVVAPSVQEGCDPTCSAA